LNCANDIVDALFKEVESKQILQTISRTNSSRLCSTETSEKFLQLKFFLLIIYYLELKKIIKKHKDKSNKN
jgi:hypothetical protein